MERPTLRARRPDRSHEESGPVRLNYDQDHDLPPPVYTAENNALPAALEAEQYEQEYGTDKRNVNKDVHKPPASQQFLGGMKSIWMTKHTEKTRDNRELLVKAVAREAVVYIFFLIVFTVIAFSHNTTSMYYFTKVVNDLFTMTSPTADQKKFYEIQTTDDVWEFMQGHLLNSLYWDERNMQTNYSDRSMIFYENRLLGYPRLRMLKVSNRSCDVVHGFRREVTECFSSYQEPNEERLEESSSDRAAYNYQPDSDLQSEWIWGQVSTYGGGGYVQELSINNKNESAHLIADLKKNRWISRGTRALFIDFSIYNANLNLFCVVQLLLEIPASGGILPSATVNTMKLLRYVTATDFFVLAMEAVFCAFILYYIVEKAIEIVTIKGAYFKSVWNILDLIVLGVSGPRNEVIDRCSQISIAVIILSLRRTLMIRSKVGSLLNGVHQYENLQSIVFAENRYTEGVSILIYFVYIKLFKYASINKTMNQLNATLGRAAKDIGGFGVMFAIFYAAYVQFGFLAFGCQIAEYSTIYSASFTLLRTILGDFDFNALQKANRVLGPIFFLTYIFLVFFVLLNMFLAIINDAYSEVKGEFRKQADELQVADYVKQGFYKTARFFRRDRPDGTQEFIDYDTFKDEMVRKGYSTEEIDEQFAKYSVEEPAVDQGQLALPRSEKEPLPADGADKQCIVLNRRVDGVEHAIASLAATLDSTVRSLGLDNNQTTKLNNDMERTDFQKMTGEQHGKQTGSM
uniref:PKD_channel domain-containing protein n=1 Tax=Steinernema glaseri TaxID=37863 RepID=A0A1I7Y2U4_9BILA